MSTRKTQSDLFDEYILGVQNEIYDSITEDNDFSTFMKYYNRYTSTEITMQTCIAENSSTNLLRYRFNNVSDRDNWYRQMCDGIVIPKGYIEAGNKKGKISYQKSWDQYKFIEQIPQPEQKSQAWFDMRNNFITASSAGDILGTNIRAPRFELMLKKIGAGLPFTENMHVYHGKKYEFIATLIYEYSRNVKVGEFGLVSHLEPERIDFIGASPDGICTCCALDGTFSPLVGRMLEIKCVTTRKLNNQGEVYGTMIPKYYWIQTQIQMECCNLEECDFWQCKIEEYQENIGEYEDWYEKVRGFIGNGVDPMMHTEEQAVPRFMDKRYCFGMLIELYPKDTSIVPPGDEVRWYSKYIYPTNLSGSLDEKLKWSRLMKKNWKKFYPEYAQDYTFNQVVYWTLDQSICNLIKRDRKWFADNLPEFRKFWDEVLYLRGNKKARDEYISRTDEMRAEQKAAIRQYYAQLNAEKAKQQALRAKTLKPNVPSQEDIQRAMKIFDDDD